MFILDHLRSRFFRSEAQRYSGPISKLDLAAAVDEAYVYRSKYVHTLGDIPSQITLVPNTRDTIGVEGKAVLTLNGIARIAREVITTYIERGTISLDDEFDYRANLPNVTSLEMAPQYWIDKAAGYSTKLSRRFLSGFVAHFLDVHAGNQSGLAPLSDVLRKAEGLIKGVSTSQRAPMLALYMLWNNLIQEQSRLPGWELFLKRYEQELWSPSIDMLAPTLILLKEPIWPALELEKIIYLYLEQRTRKDGLRLPLVLEAASLLELADLYRGQGLFPKAYKCVQRAVEIRPGHQGLLDIERRSSSVLVPPTRWRKVVFG